MTGGKWTNDEGAIVWLTPDGDGVELDELDDPRCPPELRLPAKRDLYAVLRKAEQVDRLAAENEAFRKAIRDGDGPFCDDVCMVECIGVCGAESTS